MTVACVDEMPDGVITAHGCHLARVEVSPRSVIARDAAKSDARSVGTCSTCRATMPAR